MFYVFSSVYLNCLFLCLTKVTTERETMDMKPVIWNQSKGLFSFIHIQGAYDKFPNIFGMGI